jgi:hypothetical protein
MGIVSRNGVETAVDASGFVWRLLDDLRTDPESWEVADLESYLRAVAEVLGSLDSVQALDGTNERSTPTWRTIAEVLYAAKIRE